MSALILAEQQGQQLHPATLVCLEAAQCLHVPVDVLLMGDDCDEIAHTLQCVEKVRTLWVSTAPHYAHLLAEDVASCVAKLAKEYAYLMAPATALGKNVWPRVATELNVELLSEITAIEAPDVFVRPIYAGNAYETVKLHAQPCCLTVRPTAFSKASIGEHPVAKRVALESQPAKDLSQFLSMMCKKNTRPELSHAKIVVSGGRGLQSQAQFELIYQLADCLGAAVGASRAAVDSGWIDNEYQVGQTGQVVAPDLYIAVGISGAIQHLAGMKDSRVIVAINQDPDAPIFDIADYGLVGDLFEIVPAFIKELSCNG